MSKKRNTSGPGKAAKKQRMAAEFGARGDDFFGANAADMNALSLRYNFKYVSSSVSSGSLVNSSPNVACMNVMSQGSDETNRVGDIVKWKAMAFGVSFSANSALVIPILCRFVIVQESTALGSLPGVSQIWNSSTPTVNEQRNIATRNAKRFRILFDSGPFAVHPYVGSAGALTSGGPAIWARQVELPLNVVSDYSRGNSGSVSDIEGNTITAIAYTENTTANAIGYSLKYVMKGVN